jgi:DNA-binding GntR family transcriptional regulator
VESQRRGGAKAEARRSSVSKRRRPGALTTQTRELIEQKIITGEIAAGEKLNAYALARTIGVSRSPVREALHALEQTGLVQAIPNRGLFVRVLDLREMIDLYDIRIGLARQAGRLLAGRITDEQIVELERLYKRMDRAQRSRDGDSYYRLDALLHTQLMEYTGNRTLAVLDERLKNQMRLFLRRGVSGEPQRRLSHRNHRALLDAIVRRDPDAAASAYELHSICGKQNMIDTVGRGPDVTTGKQPWRVNAMRQWTVPASVGGPRGNSGLMKGIPGRSGVGGKV